MDRQDKFFATVFGLEIPMHLWERQLDEHHLPVLLLTVLTGVLWWLHRHAMSPLAHRRVALPLLTVAAATVAVAGSQPQSSFWSPVAALILAGGVVLTTRMTGQLTRPVEAFGLGVVALAVLSIMAAVVLPPQTGLIRWAMCGLAVTMIATALSLLFLRSAVGLVMYLYAAAFAVLGVALFVDPFARSLHIEAGAVLVLTMSALIAACAYCHQRGISLNCLLLPVCGALAGAVVGLFTRDVLLVAVLGILGAAAGTVVSIMDCRVPVRVASATVVLAATYVLGGAHLLVIGQMTAAVVAALTALALAWLAAKASGLTVA